jgi:hypothetical protein
LQRLIHSGEIGQRARDLVDAAERYVDELGWDIIPVVGKRPLKGVKWARGSETPWNTRREMLCSPRATGIAVLLGERSGGLIARDFDDARAYDRWCEREPGLAAQLPTAQSRRGYHIYAYATEPTATQKLPGHAGELRADGAYLILPPSNHPSGPPHYRWLRSPYEPDWVKLRIDPTRLCADISNNNETAISVNLLFTQANPSRHIACDQ